MKVTDPVCGMKFLPEKAAATLQYGNQTYYFCADACRKQFEAEPERFLRDLGGR
ncbi:MAG TPA: YHS domain-containing protein [Gemmatimonadales bacterium]|nr:YHS domain-containing protein [Gemmatimonadales bacterium]